MGAPSQQLEKPHTAHSPAAARSIRRASFLAPSVSLILQSHRNLSQLPNFAFSVPLAYFFLSQQEECPEQERGQAREKAARLIQLALVMFPSGKSVPTGKSVPAGFGAVFIWESEGRIPGRQMQRQELAWGMQMVPVGDGSPDSEGDAAQCCCAHIHRGMVTFTARDRLLSLRRDSAGWGRKRIRILELENASRGLRRPETASLCGPALPSETLLCGRQVLHVPAFIQLVLLAMKGDSPAPLGPGEDVFAGRKNQISNRAVVCVGRNHLFSLFVTVAEIKPLFKFKDQQRLVQNMAPYFTREQNISLFFIYSGSVSVIHTETKTQQKPPEQHPRSGCCSPGLGLSPCSPGDLAVLLSGLLLTSSLPLSRSSHAAAGSLQRAARCQGRLPPLFRAERPDKVSPGGVVGEEEESIWPAVGLLLA